MQHHQRLQRRVFYIVSGLALLTLLIATPFVVNNDLRYDTAMRLNMIPGQDAEHISDANDGALLITVPLNNGYADGPTPWLYRAQYIAWPAEGGVELENLETHQRVLVPLESIEFTAGNGDGSLLILRGPSSEESGEAAFTVSYPDDVVTKLPDADSVPDAAGDWDTPTWAKTRGICNRPSPGKTIVGCFNRADAASYLAGDWQLDAQVWGDFENVDALYRGQGFLPWLGFAENDTVLYLQNERGIVRVQIPQDVLDQAPTMTPYGTPVRDASPVPQ